MLGQKKLLVNTVAFLEAENIDMRNQLELTKSPPALCPKCTPETEAEQQHEKNMVKTQLNSLRASRTHLRSNVEVQNALIESFLRKTSGGDEELMCEVAAEAFEVMGQMTEQFQQDKERVATVLEQKVYEMQKQVNSIL